MKINYITFLSILALLLSSCQTQKTDVSGTFKPTKQNEILGPDSRIEMVWDKGGFTEGPTALENNSILFTDCPTRIMKFDPRSGKTTVWSGASNGAGGMKSLKDGSVVICQGADGGGRRIVRVDKNGKETVLTDNYAGNKFNSPNDIDAAPNGDIYFTDPRYSGKEKRELSYEGVFVIRKDKTILATDKLQRPNGILISGDGRYAFVADNNNLPGGKRTLERFEIKADGSFSNMNTLLEFRDDQRGIDGMALDEDGNIYATAGVGKDAGIYVVSPEGEQLAFIDVPEFPTNCTFGGPGEPNTLYITAQIITGQIKPLRMGLYRIKLKKKSMTSKLWSNEANISRK